MAMILILSAMAASVVGAIALCTAIETRNRKEARRELFGLAPGEDSWP
jgi:hypothetical protein